MFKNIIIAEWKTMCTQSGILLTCPVHQINSHHKSLVINHSIVVLKTHVKIRSICHEYTDN